MRNRWLIFIGILFIVLGLMSLISTIFQVDLGEFCCPIGLIALGIFLLLRPLLGWPGQGVELRLLGDVRRFGEWEVTDQEFWLGVGELRLDLTEAQFPPGETRLRVFGFVGDVKLFVPPDVGISLLSGSFITDARILGRKRDAVLMPLEFASEGYEAAQRRLRLETTCFITNLRVVEIQSADQKEDSAS